MVVIDRTVELIALVDEAWSVQTVLAEHDVQELLNAVLALLPVSSLGVQVTVVVSVSQVKYDGPHQRASFVRSCFQTASISSSVSVIVHLLSL